MLPENPELATKRSMVAIAAIVAVALVILRLNGRVLWCQEGDYAPWSFAVWSGHNSQHVLDPYSFTHVLHGVVEFWLIGLFFSAVPR